MESKVSTLFDYVVCCPANIKEEPVEVKEEPVEVKEEPVEEENEYIEVCATEEDIKPCLDPFDCNIIECESSTPIVKEETDQCFYSDKSCYVDDGALIKIIKDEYSIIQDRKAQDDPSERGISLLKSSTEYNMKKETKNWINKKNLWADPGISPISGKKTYWSRSPKTLVKANISDHPPQKSDWKTSCFKHLSEFAAAAQHSHQQAHQRENKTVWPESFSKGSTTNSSVKPKLKSERKMSRPKHLSQLSARANLSGRPPYESGSKTWWPDRFLQHSSTDKSSIQITKKLIDMERLRLSKYSATESKSEQPTQNIDKKVKLCLECHSVYSPSSIHVCEGKQQINRNIVFSKHSATKKPLIRLTAKSEKKTLHSDRPLKYLSTANLTVQPTLTNSNKTVYYEDFSETKSPLSCPAPVSVKDPCVKECCSSRQASDYLVTASHSGRPIRKSALKCKEILHEHSELLEPVQKTTSRRKKPELKSISIWNKVFNDLRKQPEMTGLQRNWRVHRDRNNAASKKSRQKRKEKQEMLMLEKELLEERNIRLKKRAERLEQVLHYLRSKVKEEFVKVDNRKELNEEIILIL